MNIDLLVLSLFTHGSFDTIKHKLNFYRGEDCMKKFCEDLKEHATKIINYEKKEMIPLRKEEKNISYAKKVLYMQKRI